MISRSNQHMDEIRPREQPWSCGCVLSREFFQSARSKKSGRRALREEVSLMWGQHSPYSPDVISDSSLGINTAIFPGIYRAFHSRRARRGSSSKRHEQLESLVRSAVLFSNALRMLVVVWFNAKVKQVHCLLDATRHLKPGAHLFFCPSLWLLLVRFFSVPGKSLKFKADWDIYSLLYVSLCDIYLGTLVMTDSVD